MQNMMQKGLSSFLGGGGSTGDAGGLKSALSGLGGLNRDHPLVQHVQQNAVYKIQIRLRKSLNIA
jgi:hypothetical protein